MLQSTEYHKVLLSNATWRTGARFVVSDTIAFSTLSKLVLSWGQLPCKLSLKATTGKAILGLFTSWASKTCHFVFDYNSRVPRWILLFVPVETKMNTLQFSFLMTRWCHKCITLHVTKIYFIKLLLKIKYTGRLPPPLRSNKLIVHNFCRKS